MEKCWGWRGYVSVSRLLLYELNNFWFIGNGPGPGWCGDSGWIYNLLQGGFQDGPVFGCSEDYQSINVNSGQHDEQADLIFVTQIMLLPHRRRINVFGIYVML